MLEGRRPPGSGVGVVAGQAIETEFRRDMVRISRAGECLIVALAALGAGPGKLLPLLIAMAGVTVRRRMLTTERKTARRVQTENILPVVETHGSVAALAIVAQLALVEVGVTVDTECRGLGELQLYMAGLTLDLLMRAGELVSRNVVGKLGQLLLIFPGFYRVTLSAVEFDLAMRTVGGSAGGSRQSAKPAQNPTYLRPH